MLEPAVNILLVSCVFVFSLVLCARVLMLLANPRPPRRKPLAARLRLIKILVQALIAFAAIAWNLADFSKSLDANPSVRGGAKPVNGVQQR